MIVPMRGHRIDIKELKERMGVTPDLVGDMMVLIGDLNYNLPGAKGIGQKKAAKMLAEYGSLDGVLAAAPSIKAPKMRQMLLESMDIIASTRCHFPCRTQIDALPKVTCGSRPLDLLLLVHTGISEHTCMGVPDSELCVYRDAVRLRKDVALPPLKDMEFAKPNEEVCVS